VPPSADVNPPVRLGRLIQGGLAPAILAIVERGVRRSPQLAATLSGEVELAVDGSYPPVRIVFEPGMVLVEDGPAEAPALWVAGELGDLISLLVAPAVGGVPSPMTSRGRSALGLVASRRIRVRGRIALLRRLLSIMRI
jgi:hypothetical protein